MQKRMQARALAQEGTSSGHELLKANTVSEMLTQLVSSGDDILGLHVFLFDEAANIWGHDGSEEGVSTEVGFNTSNDIGVIVLSNLQDVDVSSIFSEAYMLGLKL